MSYSFFFFLTYLLVLLAAFILPRGISDYNAIVLMFFCILFSKFLKCKSVLIPSAILGILIGLTSLKHLSIYVLIDLASIFFIFSCVYIGGCLFVSPREFKIIKKVFICLYIASCAGIFIPSLYQFYEGDGLRYAGLFHNINFSANVFAILGVAIWEIQKKESKKMYLLVIVIIGLFLYLFATRTRSLLFTFPYWFYQIYKYSNRKVLFAFVVILLPIGLSLSLNYFMERMHLDKVDSSMTTRALLYDALFSGIIENYTLIPAGSHSATDLAINLTGNEKFTPHNDVLRYIYEWGYVFYFFCLFFFFKVRRKIKFDGELSLILFVMISFALHNMMLAVYVWIPFIYVLSVRRIDCYEQGCIISNSKKIQ